MVLIAAMGIQLLGSITTLVICPLTLLTVGVSVDLPKTTAAQLNSKGDPIVVSIKQNGDLYIQERVIESMKLLPRLKAISSGNKNLRIYVRGDRVVAYGRIMEIMSLVNSAGYIKVALVTQNPKEN